MTRREQTVCFTGHREISPADCAKIRRQLDETIEDLIEQGAVFYRTGGALGFDTLAAQAVLRARERYPQIRLALVLPYRTQARRWSEEDKTLYESIKAQADEVTYVSEEYTRACMFRRNRRLVDDGGICVAYLTEDSGGTAYTVKYARAKGLKVINLAER